MNIESSSQLNLPSWFKQPVPKEKSIRDMQELLSRHGLHSVCKEARCPNQGQCWEKKTATFMILGETCTRSCRFCSVSHGVPNKVDSAEPCKVAEAVKILNLKYVVITSVTRDDLPDQGSSQFIQTAAEIKKMNPDVKVEILVPDFSNEDSLIQKVAHCGADVIAHNIEMVEWLFSKIRQQTDYQRSLAVLENYKKSNSKVIVKSGFMVGLGETTEEIFYTINDLKNSRCDIVTIGQYLAPKSEKDIVPVQKFYTPEEFKTFENYGMEIGLPFVFSGPLVRSSYLAEEGYKRVKELEC